MKCNLCKNLVIASSVTTSGGITTITVPAGTSFENGNVYCIGLFLTVPAGTNGTQINITDGTVTYTVYNRKANYFRPCNALRGRSILHLVFLNDPSHFIIANSCSRR